MNTEKNTADRPVTPDQGSGPLAGVRVLEIGSTVAGPFCARLMADFGAEVVKIEQPGGDAVRTMGSHKNGHSLYGASIFRNKQLVSIDLRTDKGRDLVRKLCGDVDVVVENFRPGTLERWDLGYDVLSKANPGLILVRISGFGQDGPYSSRGGYGVVGEAVSGLRGITGDPDRPPPRAATSLADYIAGLYGAFGAMMALVERQRTGRGQVVDSTLYEGSFSFMEPHVPAYQQLGIVAERSGPKLPGSTPNSIYPAKDGGYVVIAAASDSVFERLCQAIGKPDLMDDERFRTASARNKHAAECDAEVAAWTRENTVANIDLALGDAKVPSSHIYSIKDIFEDVHFRERDMLVELFDEKFGDITLTGVVPKLSETPGKLWRVGQQTGTDTREILSAKLGLSASEIESLEAEGIVCSAGPGPSPKNNQDHTSEMTEAKAQ